MQACYKSYVLRRVKLLTAILLLPCCFAVGQVFFGVVIQLGFSGMVLVPLAAGSACMLLLYTYMPKPIWAYVLGHEFSHAIACMLCGGRVKGMKISNNGGHVYVTRDNFFVTLAPYFTPIYAIAVFAVFALGRQVLGWGAPVTWAAFFWALGLTYSFHVLLTWDILHTRQPDIISQGYLFSAVVVFLGNALVAVLGVVFVSNDIRLPQIAHSLGDEVSETYRIIGGLVQNAPTAINSALNSFLS